MTEYPKTLEELSEALRLTLAEADKTPRGAGGMPQMVHLQAMVRLLHLTLRFGSGHYGTSGSMDSSVMLRAYADFCNTGPLTVMRASDWCAPDGTPQQRLDAFAARPAVRLWVRAEAQRRLDQMRASAAVASYRARLQALAEGADFHDLKAGEE